MLIPFTVGDLQNYTRARHLYLHLPRLLQTLCWLALQFVLWEPCLLFVHSMNQHSILHVPCVCLSLTVSSIEISLFSVLVTTSPHHSVPANTGKLGIHIVYLFHGMVQKMGDILKITCSHFQAVLFFKIVWASQFMQKWQLLITHGYSYEGFVPAWGQCGLAARPDKS